MTALDPVAGLTSSEDYVAGLLGGYTDQFAVGTDRTKLGGIENPIEYNGKRINTKGTQDAVLITAIEGLADADIRDSRENNPGYDGETAFNSYYGGRTIVLNGILRSGSLSKLRDMQEGLKSVFATLDEAPLVLKGTSIDRDLQIMCRKSQPITMAETQQGFNFTREFQVTLRASDFRFTSNTNKEVQWEREYSQAVLEDIPAMFLRLTEEEGSVAADSSGFNRSGEYTGSPTPSGVSAVDGGVSYDFDGTDDFIKTGFNPFTPSGALTLEAWVNRQNASSEQAIFGASGTDAPSVKLGSGNDTVTVAVNSSHSVSFASTGIGTNEWNHVAVTFTPASSNYQIKLYVNGSEHTDGFKTASGSWVDPDHLMIGATEETATDFFNGNIAEIAVYDKVLGSSAILSHYRAATGYFQGEVFAANAVNNGSYLADPIIKVEGPVYATASGALGLTITNQANSVTNSASIGSQSYETTAQYEILGGTTSTTLRIDSNKETIMNAKSSDSSAPYEVIGQNEFILINTKNKTVNVYSSLNNSLTGSAYAQLDKDSQWIKLVPGTNPIYIDCTASSNPKVTIYFREAFI